MTKAVGLLSGGLDSTLACRLIQNQNIEVYVVTIAMTWGCGNIDRVKAVAKVLNLPLKIMPLEDDYLKVLKEPVHGYGSAHNPCVDCHVYMVRKAAEHMRAINGDFVFTGEVVGQRPMSQRRTCLDWVENEAGVPGRLLRPLSAQLLPPTIPEQEGLVDRSKLLDISGRSRKRQIRLSQDWGLKGFAQPGGGCLLTEKIFGARIEDVLKRGCSHINETAILGAGRYFRLADRGFVMLGRNDDENRQLLQWCLPGDRILRSEEFAGPTAVARGTALTSEDLLIAAGLIQYFSKSRGKPPFWIECEQKGSGVKSLVLAAVLEDTNVVDMQVGRV